VEHDNPYATGMTGLLGTESGHYSMERADLVFLLGTDFPYTAWYPKKPRMVQLDIRAEHLGRRSKLELGLMGDVKATIEALVPMLKKKKSDKHLKDCMQKYRDTQKSLERRAEANGRSRTLPPEHLTAVLNDVADDDAIFTVDTGMTAVWAARHLRMTHRRRLIGSFNYGSMANAMPQAIGAQLAFPKRQVICMSGDGGFSMLLGDLLTIAQYELPIKLVIYNNSSLAMVKLEMRVAGYEDFGVDVQNLDFSKIAEAVGIRGFRIEDAKDLKSTLAKAVRHPGAALIDVVTNPNALALPPKIDANELAGYGLYVAKQTLHGRLFQSVEELKGNIP
jgi:pyruvate dehydrogenase (quinone)